MATTMPGMRTPFAAAPIAFAPTAVYQYLFLNMFAVCVDVMKNI